MKNYMVLFLMTGLTFTLFAQEFDPGMDKVATVRYINSIIKPDGNKAALSSVSTKVSYTENYFATATRKTYNLNLKNVNFAIKGKGVVLKCKTGNCIEYELSEPENSETTQVNELLLNTDQPSNLLKALKLLKTRVGL